MRVPLKLRGISLLALIIAGAGGCDCGGSSVRQSDLVITDHVRSIRQIASESVNQRIRNRSASDPIEEEADGVVLDQTQLLKRIKLCNDFMLKKDVARLRSCYTKTSRAGRAGGAKALVGSFNIVERLYGPAWTAFPALKGGAEKILVNDRRVALMAWGHGKHTGNLRGVEASERTLGLRSIRLLTMSPGGHIMNDVSYADTVSVMGQLGLMEGDHRPAFETPPDGTEDVIADGDRQEEENRKIADLFLTRWNQHDVAGLRDLLTEDAILHDQVYPSDQEGRDAILTQEGALFHAISNLRAKQRDAWNAGAYVIQSQEWMGTHDGDLLELGLMKTRRAFKIPVAVVQRLEEGKVAEVWRYWDLAQLLRQLDLMDAP